MRGGICATRTPLCATQAWTSDRLGSGPADWDETETATEAAATRSRSTSNTSRSEDGEGACQEGAYRSAKQPEASLRHSCQCSEGRAVRCAKRRASTRALSLISDSSGASPAACTFLLNYKFALSLRGRPAATTSFAGGVHRATEGRTILPVVQWGHVCIALCPFNSKQSRAPAFPGALPRVLLKINTVAAQPQRPV